MYRLCANNIPAPHCHLHCHWVCRSVMAEEQLESFSSDKAVSQQPVIDIHATTLWTSMHLMFYRIYH